MIHIQLTRRPFIAWRRETLSTTAIGSIALTVSILSGSTFNAFAKELSAVLSPLSLLFVSELLTFIFILMTFGFFPIVKNIRKLDRRSLIILAIIGSLTGVVGPFFWFAGVSHTTAINAGFFSRIEMVFLLLLAHFLLKEKMTRAHLTACVTILTGTMIISLKGFTDGLTLAFGDILVISGVLSYALGHVIYRKYLHFISPPLPLLARTIVAIATFFVVSPFLQHPFAEEMRAMPESLLVVLIGFAFVSRFLNSMTFYEAVDRLPVSTISLVSSLSIVTSTIFAWAYLNEGLHWYHIAGGAFVVLGTVLLELIGKHEDVPEEHMEQHMKHRMPH